MSDLVERLRDKWQHSEEACYEAADEIERLRAQVAVLREALKDVVEAWDWWSVNTFDRCESVPGGAINDARAALKVNETKGE